VFTSTKLRDSWSRRQSPRLLSAFSAAMVSVAPPYIVCIFAASFSQSYGSSRNMHSESIQRQRSSNCRLMRNASWKVLLSSMSGMRSRCCESVALIVILGWTEGGRYISGPPVTPCRSWEGRLPHAKITSRQILRY
jgi:hypothetical protein